MHVCMHAQSLSCVQLSVTPWIVAFQSPLSTWLPRQECWSGLPFPPPGDLSHPGLHPVSPESPALAGGFFTNELPGKPIQHGYCLPKLPSPSGTYTRINKYSLNAWMDRSVKSISWNNYVSFLRQGESKPFLKSIIIKQHFNICVKFWKQ